MRTDAQGEMAPRASILVVDDEPMLLRGYTRLLRAAGYEVDTAGDGREANELVGRKDFDVIVSDIAMPGMTGVELLRAIREHDADVPVVLVTGSPTLETAVPALEFGALLDPRSILWSTVGLFAGAIALALALLAGALWLVSRKGRRAARA